MRSPLVLGHGKKTKLDTLEGTKQCHYDQAFGSPDC